MRDGVLWDHDGPLAVGIPSCISAVDELLMNHFSISSPTDDIRIPRSPEAITAVAWAPDGSVAVSGDQIGELILWKDAKAVATAQVSWGSHSSDTACWTWKLPCDAWGRRRSETWSFQSTEMNLWCTLGSRTHQFFDLALSTHLDRSQC